MKPKHVVVIGSGSAIGQAVAEKLAVHQITVSGISRTPVQSHSSFAHAHAVDYATADWLGLFQQLQSASGLPIDAVLHAPGYAAIGPALTIPESEARQMLEVNFWLLSNVARAAATHWSSQKQAGHFWAVLSIAALRGIPEESYYCAAKAAAARFLECLDLENRQAGRHFNYFCPGKFASPFRSKSARFGQGASEDSGGSTVDFVARKISSAILSQKPVKVIGWRENAIALADRLFPHLYDRLVLDRRVKPPTQS